VNGDALLLAAFGDEDDRLFAEHEGNRVPEESSRNHRAARRDGAGAFC
jgi:hypothetical protein